jgi:hypothetical protein
MVMIFQTLASAARPRPPSGASPVAAVQLSPRVLVFAVIVTHFYGCGSFAVLLALRTSGSSDCLLISR